MYSTRSGLIFGFHGCDKTIVEEIILNKKTFRNSKNSYDWLGHGVYFWENSPSRALNFATELKSKPQKSSSPSVTTPAVIGATLDLGYCLDLLDYKNLNLLKFGYELLKESYEKSGFPLPKNKKPKHSNELLIRDLDCAVIEILHSVREKKGLRKFDSVRGVFWEGQELYPDSGFREKDHIQICIRNPNCIKAIFLPRDMDNNYPKV